jgi:DNA-binding NtrC family response regulator
MDRKFILVLDGSAAAMYKLSKLVAGVSDAQVIVAHSAESAIHQIERFLPLVVVVSSRAFAELGQTFVSQVEQLSPGTSVLVATGRSAENGEVIEGLIPAKDCPAFDLR